MVTASHKLKYIWHGSNGFKSKASKTALYRHPVDEWNIYRMNQCRESYLREFTSFHE